MRNSGILDILFNLAFLLKPVITLLAGLLLLKPAEIFQAIKATPDSGALNKVQEKVGRSLKTIGLLMVIYAGFVILKNIMGFINALRF